MSNDEFYAIDDVMSACMHDICGEVEYEYIKPKIADLFPPVSIQRAEAGNKCSYDKMIKICDFVRRLSKSDFKRFVVALQEDYSHIAQLIIDKYKEKTGRSLLVAQETETHGIQSSQPHAENYASYSPIQQNSPPKSVESAKEEYKKVEKFSLQEGQMCETDLRERGLLVTESNPSLLTTSSNSQLQEPLATPPVPQTHQTQGENWHVLNRSPAQNNRAGLYEMKKYEDSDGVYSMNTNPRGLALVINNVDFQHFDPRNGSDEDQARIFHMFRFLGYRVSLENNKTTREMKKLLESFAKYSKLRSVSALAVVILTHGSENDILFGRDGQIGKDYNPVQGTYITKFQLGQFFTKRNCPAMAGKPKLFILQACRGGLEDESPSPSTSEEGPNLLSYDGPESSSTVPKTAVSASASSDMGQATGADTADMCFLHSSSSGYKAYRASTRGSPFLEKLTEHIERDAETKEFRDIVQEVQRYFNGESLPNNMMTLPDLSIQLLKKWYMNPAPIQSSQ